MTPFIKIKNLTFAYPTEKSCSSDVLKNISIDVMRGEFVTVLGHNGCGKSTLSKILNGMLRPSSGTVFVDGLNTSDENQSYNIRKKVSLVLQNPENQIVAGIVEDDVAFGPENIGVPAKEIRKKVDDALNLVDMYKYKSWSSYKLSGGQKQRISIAGAIAMSPECIVLDEPTSMLDPKGRKEVLQTIKKLNHELGMTVVLITHFMDEAIKADKVIVMSKGAILTQGLPCEVFSQVDLLKRHSLDVPQPTQLMKNFVDSTVLTIEDSVNILSQRLPKTKFLSTQKVKGNVVETQKTKMRFDDVSFYYGKNTSFEKKALSDVSLEILDGQFIGLIGQTGSGKSTFLQHLNALIKPFSGRVLLDEHDINQSKKIAKKTRFKVGIVFQYPEHQLFEETVFQDVAFGPKNMKLSEKEIEKRVLQAVEFVGLDKKILQRSPFDLSGGEKRRVAIAGVLAMDPEVFVLDEPTAGLDPLGKTSLLEKIKKYHDLKKNTVVMVSHNMEDIARVSDKIIVLKDGSVKMYDQTQSVFENTDLFQTLGLYVPPITQIMSELRKKGFDVSSGILDVQSAVTQIKRLIVDGRS